MPKPSEVIVQMAKELSRQSWIAYGGNRFSKEQWEEMSPTEPDKRDFVTQAILKYLDTIAE